MRPIRLITATSLVALASVLGGCDVATFTASQTSEQGISADDASRAVDRLFEALARGDREAAARSFSPALPHGASAANVVEGLNDGPLRMVDRVLWTQRTTRSSLTGPSGADLEGLARLRNGDDIPVKAQLSYTDGRWAVVSLAASGQQRASVTRRSVTSSTTVEAPALQTSTALPQATPPDASRERIATHGTGTVTSSPMALPEPTAPAPNIRLAQAPQPVPGQATEPSIVTPPPPVQPRSIQTAPAPQAPQTPPAPAAAPPAPRAGAGQLPVGPPPPMPPGQATAVPAPAQPPSAVTSEPPQPPQPRQAAPAPQPRSGGAPLPPPVQASDIPDEASRIALVQETMHLIVGSLVSNDYSSLHGNSSRFFQQTHNVRDLQRVIRVAFSGLNVDQNTLTNRQPRLIGQPFVHQDGMWRQQGIYDFGSRRIAFRFAFTAEDGVWKLGRFILQQGGLSPQSR